MNEDKREVMRNYVRRILERFPTGTPVRYTTGQLKATGGHPFGKVVAIEPTGWMMPFVVVETFTGERLTILSDNIEPLVEPIVEPAPKRLTCGQIASDLSKDERILRQALSSLETVRNLYSQGESEKAVNLYNVTRLVLGSAMRSPAAEPVVTYA